MGKTAYASRQVKSSKTATRYNRRRQYRLMGQIFTRLLYPDVEKKTILPPGKVTNPDNLFDRALFQVGASDYAYRNVEMVTAIPEVVKKGVFIEKTPRKELKPRIKCKPDGTFDFGALRLRPGVEYELSALLRGGERVNAELIKARFTIPRGVITKAQPDVQADVSVKVTHQTKFNVESVWTKLGEENFKAKYTVGGDDVGKLWLGGPGALVFYTFMLNVPYLNQDDVPTEDINLTFDGKKFFAPLRSAMICGATCTTMVLNYYGVKVKVRDVVIEANRAYMEAHRKDKDYDLLPGRADKQEIFTSDNRHPHCQEEYLIAAAKRLMRKQGVAEDKIHATWRSHNPVQDSAFNDARMMLGAGWPIIAIKALGGSNNPFDITHAVVIKGMIIDGQGQLKRLYINDPFTQVLFWEDDKKFRGQIIIGQDLPQKSISGGTTQRLHSGGEVPAAKRKLHV